MTAYTCSECGTRFMALGAFAGHIAWACPNGYRLEKPALMISARCFVCPWEITQPVKEARLAIRAHFDAHPSQTIAGKHVCRQNVICQCGWVGNECSTRSDVDASISYHRGMHRAGDLR